MIDDAMAKAKARLTAGVERMDKEASAPTSLTKEASEVANALEYVALATVDDGSAVGAARKEMVTDFLSKSAAAGGPAVSATTTSGTQSQVPVSSKKTIQPGGKPGDTNPENSEAPTGKMPENILRQMPPSTKSTPKDSGGKTANMSLYDILMSNKEAAAGGAAEMDSEQALTGVPQGGDGQAHAHALLSSNTAPVEATKREAKKPTRPRLAEVWDSAGDTTGDASAGAVWPGAAAKGDIKIAEADKEAGRTDATIVGGLFSPFAGLAAEKGKGWRTTGGALLGDIAGSQVGDMAGRAVGGPVGQIGGATLGRLAGGAGGAYVAHGPDKKKDSEKKASIDTMVHYSEVFSKALNGEFGKEAQAYAEQVESV